MLLTRIRRPLNRTGDQKSRGGGQRHNGEQICRTLSSSLIALSTYLLPCFASFEDVRIPQRDHYQNNMIRLYEEFKSKLFFTGRMVKTLVLLPFYGLNFLVTILAKNLELYILDQLATPEIADRYEKGLIAARAILYIDLKNHYLEAGSNQLLEE